MNLSNENEKRILDYFEDNNWYPTNSGKLIEYLKDNGYIKTQKEVVEEHVEVFKIKVPNYKYLDEEWIIKNDEDYIHIGNDKYLNDFRINNEIYDDLFKNELIRFEIEVK